MFRRQPYLTWLLLFLLVLTGCVAPQDNLEAQQSEETMIISDSLGRQVPVPKKVERIAALYSFAGYATCLMGGGDRLVAVPGGLQRDVLLVDLFPGIENASVPREGGTINIEELLRIAPDLVIVRADTVAEERERDKLDDTGIPYLVVHFETIEEQRQVLMMIGRAIGEEENAKAFDAYYDRVLQRVDQGLSKVSQSERVRVYHSENQALRTTHKDTLSADWAREAGFINVSVGQDLDLQNNDYYATIEQVLLWDPEVIFTNETAARKLILGHPHWSGIEAVQKEKVYKLPQGISRWGHPGSVETPLALYWAVKTLYPEHFQQLDLREEIQAFYNDFFQLPLSEEMVTTILEGRDLREDK